MLVLSRKTDETIHIGNDIVIRICQINGSTIRIGIDAPKEISIKRGELINWESNEESGTQSLDCTTASFNQQRLLRR